MNAYKSGRRIDPDGVIHDWARLGYATVCGIQLPDPWIWTEEPTTCDKCIRGECSTTIDEQMDAMFAHPVYARMSREVVRVGKQTREFLDLCTALKCKGVRVSSGNEPVDQGGAQLPHTITISHKDLNKLTRALKRATTTATPPHPHDIP